MMCYFSSPAFPFIIHLQDYQIMEKEEIKQLLFQIFEILLG